MKYTIREQERIAKINKELEKLKKQIQNKTKRITEIAQEIDEIHILESKVANGLYEINKRVVKRCKHEGGTHRVRNWRDDASFLYWIRCDDCGETVGHEGENPGHY